RAAGPPAALFLFVACYFTTEPDRTFSNDKISTARGKLSLNVSAMFRPSGLGRPAWKAIFAGSLPSIETRHVSFAGGLEVCLAIRNERLSDAHVTPVRVLPVRGPPN